MGSSSVDYIIVGQGLAGSSIAFQLIRSGKKIMVIDQPKENFSTRIAAGLFNPITGKKLMKTWLADSLFPYLHEFYRDAEQLTGETFFYPMDLYRPFVFPEEQNEWMGKSGDEAYSGILKNVAVSSSYTGVNDSLGGLALKSCGYIDTSKFTNAVRNLIVERGSFLLQDEFKYEDLKITEDYVLYQGVRASKIIFCEGLGALKNPWFEQIPLRPLKGEVLFIKTDWKEQVILNRGVYLVPSNRPGVYRVGSTYNAHDVSTVVTAEGRNELELKLKELVNFSYEIVGHEWGIRPTMPDRRPVLGAHPKLSRLVIFNGLGTKGVSLAPYFSSVLFRWLENGTPLHKDVDVTRFKLLY
jgi:glycine oxidase